MTSRHASRRLGAALLCAVALITLSACERRASDPAATNRNAPDSPQSTPAPQPPASPASPVGP